jgi:hypothetical protein
MPCRVTVDDRLYSAHGRMDQASPRRSGEPCRTPRCVEHTRVRTSRQRSALTRSATRLTGRRRSDGVGPSSRSGALARG